MTSNRRTAQAYDAVAADYAERFRHELDGKPRDRELIDRLATRSSGVLLDVGSGPGHIGARIRSFGRPVIALDLSPAMTRGLAAISAERRAPYASEGSTNRLYLELENQ